MSGDEDRAYQKAASGKPLALEGRALGEDGRRFSPSIARNRDVLRDAFLAHMPNAGAILEVASGTGEHGAHITAAAPGLVWTYTDIDGPSRDSQRAWIAHEDRPGAFRGPLDLDASQPDWGEAERAAPYAGLVSINMVHIAPFAAARGLLSGAGRLLAPGGRLFLYGPFARNGDIAPSNAAFSGDLKRRNPDWGVRDLDAELLPLATKAGLDLKAVVDMPANNLSVIFERT